MRNPIRRQQDELTRELHRQWITFNRALRQGKLPHLAFDNDTQKLSWRKQELSGLSDHVTNFWTQLPFCELADVFRFVNQHCGFLSALTPLQPLYVEKQADEDSLMAVIMAQAMHHGNLTMSRTSDIPYSALNDAYEQYLRLSSLKAACDCISEEIKTLPVFPYYSLELGELYAAVDKQKFSVKRPTVLTGPILPSSLVWPSFTTAFTSPGDMLKALYCADDPVRYKNCFIQLAGQINQQMIINEKPNLDQIVATLGLKEITQGALIRKLCTYTAENPTRQSLFEFDKLIRSFYILRYLRDPQVARNSHRSQNRIESWHQLRSAIAQVGVKRN